MHGNYLENNPHRDFRCLVAKVQEDRTAVGWARAAWVEEAVRLPFENHAGWEPQRALQK